MKKVFLLFLTAVLFFGCVDKKDDKKKVADMKCGAGKCGANMFDGNAALAKKKANIIRQLKDGDKRKDCVAKAKSTKEAYDCVRNPKTGRLSIKCGSVALEKQKLKQKEPAMKCEAGKCSGG